MPEDIAVAAPAALSPDFMVHAPGPRISMMTVEGHFLSVVWVDGVAHRFNRFFLRENHVGDGIIDLVTRERMIPADALAEDLALVRAQTEGDAVLVDWADGVTTRHAAGWMRATAEGLWRPDAPLPIRVAWETAAMPEPVSFDGPGALTDDAVLQDWLRAAWTYGLARLRGLPVAQGTVQRVAERIGVIRSSSFGFLFTVETKPNPDSSAYTANALVGHIDLPTREMTPGFQLLHCRQNTCRDGFSTMADGIAVAEAIRAEDPDAFDALTTLPWCVSNRHNQFDYRQSRPVVRLDAQGNVVEILLNDFLRCEPDMPDSEVERAYRAIRLFMRHIQSDRFLLRYPFAPGDLVLFDNRRLLHGRDAFDPQGGVRQLEGCYVDTDEVSSRLRVLARPRR
ncbi:MAG: TauD/TfdA family dioxygenase [Pseudomonadota bacterium]